MCWYIIQYSSYKYIRIMEVRGSLPLNMYHLIRIWLDIADPEISSESKYIGKYKEEKSSVN